MRIEVHGHGVESVRRPVNAGPRYSRGCPILESSLVAEWERAFGDNDEAIARAQQRLEAVLSGKDRPQPIGRLAVPVILATVFLIAPAAALVWAAYRAYIDRRAPSPEGAAIFAVLAAVLLLGAYFVIVNAKPDTAKRALNLFYRAVGRGSSGRARRLVLASDFDDHERFAPDIDHLAPHTHRAYVFGEVGGFKAYWRDLVRYHSAPYCMVRVSRVTTTEIFPNVCVADFRLRLMMNTQLWYLLILAGGCIGLLIAVIIDGSTRKTVEIPVRKILVRAGDEWHLFNGELQGIEEEQTDWLRNLSGQQRPAVDGGGWPRTSS